MSIRVADIFCGCGGFSLGLELAGRGFGTVFALDNDPDAVGCFNRNLDPAGPGVALVRDVTDFRTPTEIRAFYLLSVAATGKDDALGSRLADLGLGGLVETVSGMDRAHEARLGALMKAPVFRAAYSRVPDDEKKSALFRRFLARFGLPSPGRYPPVLRRMAWGNGTPVPRPARGPGKTSHPAFAGKDRVGAREARRLTDRFRRDAGTVAAAFPGLGRFLRSAPFGDLGKIHLRWLLDRTATVRAFFSSPGVERRLRRLYGNGRRIDLLVGGPPCQGFSRWGRAAIGYLRREGLHLSDGDFGDERNRLFRDFVLFVAAFEPEAFLFENVGTFPSAIGTDGGRPFSPAEELERSVSRLAGSGPRYSMSSRMLDAARLGIPQNRQRFILAGVRVAPGRPADTAGRVFDALPECPPTASSVAFAGLPVRPAAYWSRGQDCGRPVVAVDGPPPGDGPDGFARWIRASRAGGTIRRTDAHVTRKPTPDDAALFRRLPPGTKWHEVGSRRMREMLRGINPRHHLLRGGYLRKRGGRHGDWLARIDPAGTSRAVCSHLAKDGYGYIHPTASRTITAREAARLQSFPDWFSFRGITMGTAFRQVGNAVPPLLAYHLGKAVSEVVFERSGPGPGDGNGRASRKWRGGSGDRQG